MASYFVIKTIGNFRLVTFSGKFRILNQYDEVVGRAVNQSQGYMILTEIAS